MENLISIFSTDFFYAVVRMASPIVLAAVGELMLERAGIFNLGIEAGILFGAFFGVLGSSLFQSAFMGLAVAVLAGAVLGMLYGWAVVTLAAHQAVVGTGLNILALGLTSLLSRMIWGVLDVPLVVPNIPDMPVPLLSQIPVIGRILFSHGPLVYLSYIMVGAVWFILYKTTWGLKIRSIGEHPKASATMGIPVIRWKFGMSVFAWICASVAGVILSLSFMNVFVDNISAGRGYMAVACVILGQWNPWGVLAGGLIFGAGNALQMRLQAFGVPIPTDLLLVIPMVLALLVVLLVRGKSSARPAALAKPYEK
ncbi:MAG: ABC transporter permease [Bacillota bacterium]